LQSSKTLCVAESQAGFIKTCLVICLAHVDLTNDAQKRHQRSAITIQRLLRKAVLNFQKDNQLACKKPQAQLQTSHGLAPTNSAVISDSYLRTHSTHKSCEEPKELMNEEKAAAKN